jgi:hypothetical protein
MSVMAAPKAATPTVGKATAGRLLQRKCACGSHTSSNECPDCLRKKRLQPKLSISASNDPLEQEADRIADQVTAAPPDHVLSTTPVRVQRFTGQATRDMAAAPASVDRALASPGFPLDPSLRQSFEQRFGYDFSQVRIHSDAVSTMSARRINAHAYTCGSDIVFGAGRYAPATWKGRHLLAHELAHVVQQTGERTVIQRDGSGSSDAPDAAELVNTYYWEMYADENFEGIGDRLLKAYASLSSPYAYIVDLFGKFPAQWEDSIAAAFVSRLFNRDLNKFASDKEGRYALTILYQAMITGTASSFEREQANRIIKAKLKATGPEKFVKMATGRGGRHRTPIFPIRFMRVTPGQDYATPEVKLRPDGHLLVKYPVRMKSMSTFQEEIATLGDVFGAGMDLNVNEIVGIRDYERGGDVIYLPAMALIDYANQAIESTSGKIIEVSLFTATMGVGAGAAGAKAVASEAAGLAKWGSKAGQVLIAADRVANFVAVAAFFINENRDWIISKFGSAGRRLVQLADVANSAAAVYGLGRLGQAGYGIVKDMRAASKQARAMERQLTAEQQAALNRIDDETDMMLKELDEAAATTAPPAAAGKPEAPTRIDDPAAAKLPAKAPGTAAGVANELDAAAKKIGISAKKLEAEVDDLRSQTPDLDSVREPKNPKLDAEMEAHGHKFTRDKKDRTWCRESPKKKCHLNLGEPLNSATDTALVMKKQAKFEQMEQARKAREAAPPRQPATKPEAPVVADPKAAKAKARAKETAAKASAKKALKSQIDDKKELQLRILEEIEEVNQSLKGLDPAKRAEQLAKRDKLRHERDAAIADRERLQKQLDELEITPYGRARAFSYSDAAASEVVSRARKVVDTPEGKKLALVDEMSGTPIKEPSIDHVVPIDEMVHMDGWNQLRPHQQQELLSRVDNLRLMEKGLNSAKRNKRWADWPAGRRKYGEKVWREMVEKEKELRKAIQIRINEMLAGTGKAA